MVLNEEQWIKELREKRIDYGISQGRLAVASGITREYLNKIESGKMKPSKELLETLHKELARFNPEAPLTMLFDYVKIRFPTLDIQHIIKDKKAGWQSQIGIVFARLIVRVSLHFLTSLYHALIKGIDAIYHFFFSMVDVWHDCSQVRKVAVLWV